jgi:hypothetical protein
VLYRPLVKDLSAKSDQGEQMRRLLVAAVVAGLVLGGLVLVNARPSAKAQEPVEVVFVASDRFDPNASGFVTVPVGGNDGIQGVGCVGSYPLGGTSQIPAQVLTHLQGDRTVLRVFNNLGRPVGGLVRLTCTVDAVVPAQAQAQQLKAQFTG